MVRKIYDHLAPGGYFELQDPVMPLRSDDGSLAGTALEEWGHTLAEGMGRTGRRVDGSTAWGRHLRHAGFVDVVERRFLWPVSPWCKGKRNKILGALCQANLMDGVPSMGSAVGGNSTLLPTPLTVSITPPCKFYIIWLRETKAASFSSHNGLGCFPYDENAGPLMATNSILILFMTADYGNADLRPPQCWAGAERRSTASSRGRGVT